MVKQSNTANLSDPVTCAAFFKSGAFIQVAPDQFKLIIGPFLEVSPEKLKIQIENQTIIYKPFFWDFISEKKDENQFYSGVFEFEISRSDLLSALAALEAVRPKTAWQNVLSEPFRTQFTWSQEQFQKNTLLKTVPIILQKCETHFTSQNLVSVFKNLISEKNYGWSYGFWSDREGFIGQSPELIGQWSEQTKIFKTTALAGTVSLNQKAESQILSDEKILQEHRFVVDDIQERLQKSNLIQNLKVNPTKALTLKHLIHLQTDFTAVVETKLAAFELIKLLHPTAALGLYPRVAEEMQIFSELPLQNERLNFAAPFVFIEPERLLAIAAIRSFYFFETEISIFSGCGVTAQSQYESELFELELKRESVKKMMGLSS